MSKYDSKIFDLEELERLITHYKTAIKQLRRWECLLDKSNSETTINLDIFSGTDTYSGALGLKREHIYPPPISLRGREIEPFGRMVVDILQDRVNYYESELEKTKAKND